MGTACGCCRHPVGESTGHVHGLEIDASVVCVEVVSGYGRNLRVFVNYPFRFTTLEMYDI